MSTNSSIKDRIFIWFIILIALGFLTVSCHKKSQNKPDTSIYKAEIFESQFRKIYGSWKLQQIETGWGNIKPDFDYLVIKPFGTFLILRKDSIVTSGKIEIINQDKNLLHIKFIANKNTKLELLMDSEKIIDFKNNHLIWMIAPCCDRANYLLKRKE